MQPYSFFPEGPEESGDDRIAQLVSDLGIVVTCEEIKCRPDVSIDEQESWIRQDPDFPPEHYCCTLSFNDRELVVYQTVGADYPDEDDDNSAQDLYAEQRELLLSPEFLLETTALKAASIDKSNDLEEWIGLSYCDTFTPDKTYQSYIQLRDQLKQFLGDTLYDEVLLLALEADAEPEDEEEFL
jgi:hypothetical protein